MKKRLSTALLSTAFAVYVGIAAGCGGGGGDSATAASDAAASQKPSPAATNNGNGNANGQGSGKSGTKKGTPNPFGLSVPADAAATKEGVYIVQIKDDPAMAATKSTRGNGRYDPQSSAAQRQIDNLRRKEQRLLARVGATNGKLYSYGHAFPGFAAEMTAQQAAQLATDPDVERIWSDEMRELHTNFSPEFLGLDAVNGPWDSGVNGEGVIIGVIDSGIWPNNPSFSDAGDTDYNSYGPPPAHWRGDCQSGENWSQQDCNNKLIGARYFPYGFSKTRASKARDGVFPQGYNSARDDDGVGHGSHTTSTAGGNRGVTMTLAGAEVLDDDEGSGVAPRARVAHYKACWNDIGCATSDLVAAIDTAAADGVDVINYSIGSSAIDILAPDDVAFLFATTFDNVFVATSNGNDGPDPATVGSPAGDPWVLSVGASTRDGTTTRNAVQVTEPESVADTYLAQEGTGPAMVVYGGTEGYLATPADAANFEGCDGWTNSAAGRIALISRGACSFAQKLFFAERAGAIGAIVYNNQPSGIIIMGGLEGSSVPSVMIENSAGTALAAAVDGGEDVFAILAADVFLAEPAAGNVMADFSSRGPNLGAIDIIKPDVTAPGVDILAATTPTPLPAGKKVNTGELYKYVSGTSMSSPHAAGALALIKQAHPTWTAAMAKSALMTTARQDVLKEDGATPADPFDMGSGYIVPGSALDPGLVYDAGFFDYLDFIFGVIDPSDLNYPSIGVSRLVGSKTIYRTVTSVTAGTATYCADIEAPTGIDVEVTEGADGGGCFEIDEGATHTYALTLTVNESVTANQWSFGAITWEHGPHAVRSPIAVYVPKIDAPAELFYSGADGAETFNVGFNYSGDYTALAHGLDQAETQDGNVVDDPANDINVALDTGVGITFHVFTVGDECGSGACAVARFSLFDEYTDGSDDLDLYIFGPDTADFPFVGGSGGGSSAEQVDVILPEPGVYIAAVHGWQTDGSDANYTIFQYEFGLDDDRDNFSLDSAPSASAVGTSEPIDISWTGLETGPGVKYLGAISHSSDTGIEALTIINIQND